MISKVGVKKVSVKAGKRGIVSVCRALNTSIQTILKYMKLLDMWCPGPDLNWHDSVTRLRILSPAHNLNQPLEINKHSNFRELKKASLGRQLVSFGVVCWGLLGRRSARGSVQRMGLCVLGQVTGRSMFFSSVGAA